MNVFSEAGVLLGRFPGDFPAGLMLELLEHLADRHHAILVTELDRVGDHVLRQFAAADFDHVDRPGRAGDDQIQVGVLELRTGRVDHELAIDTPHPHRGHRALERQRGNRQRGSGGRHRDHVRVDLGVRRQHAELDLHLVLETLGEQRTDRTVDHPHGQDFLAGRPAFALEEAAGELAGGGHFLAIVDLQWEEVDAFPRRSGQDRAEHDRLAIADQGRSVRLPSQSSSFD